MKFMWCMIVLLPLLQSHVIFDFTKKSDIQNWVVVDDGVMGGRSSGTFSLNSEGHGVFAGSISLENNGGFSSVRYRLQKTPVANYTTICITLKGDGKKYQCRIKSNSRDEYSYILPFSTNGKWQEIRIPLAEMYPSFRGRKLDLPNFSKEYIEEITFLIGNKNQENFTLLLDKIELQ